MTASAILPEVRIFYYCFASLNPTGGNKKIYQHVELLNRAGFAAFVVHPKDDFRLTWFASDAPVMPWSQFRQVYQPDLDWVVVPEDLGDRIVDTPWKNLVIFNQNAYYGFERLGQQPTVRDPYLCKQVKAAIVVSEQNRQLLQFAYPRLPVLRVNLDIHAERFTPKLLVNKQKLIAFDRKNRPETLAIYRTLIARSQQGLNQFQAYDWVWIEKMSETEVIQTLSQALAFVFLSYHEGFGMMPLEAMASGCVVLAFDREPMREYLPLACQVASGDLGAIVMQLEALAAAFPGQLEPWQGQVEATRSVVARYGAAQELASLVAAWRSILGLTGDARNARDTSAQVF